MCIFPARNSNLSSRNHGGAKKEKTIIKINLDYIINKFTYIYIFCCFFCFFFLMKIIWFVIVLRCGRERVIILYSSDEDAFVVQNSKTI